MEELLALPRGHDGRVLLYFALGRALDQAGRPNAPSRARARQPRRARSAALRHPGRHGHDGRHDRDLDADWFARGPVEGATDTAPILWSGCRGVAPRSWSRSSRPTARSAAPRGARAAARGPRASAVRRAAGHESALAATSTTRTSARSASATSDASARHRRCWPADGQYLTNYIYGVLARLPGARLIDVRRDPRDTVACFKTGFTSPIPFVNADDIAGDEPRGASRPHRRARAAHGAAGPLRGSRGGSRGPDPPHARVPGPGRCLRFHDEAPGQLRQRAQVRQPLFRSSIGAWKRYARTSRPWSRRRAVPRSAQPASDERRAAPLVRGAARRLLARRAIVSDPRRSRARRISA